MLIFPTAGTPPDSQCHQNQDTVSGEGFPAPGHVYIHKTLGISRKPHSSISQWLAWARLLWAANVTPTPPIFFGNIPKRLVIQQIPQFPSRRWAHWLNVTVPISLQIWVTSLQTLSLARPIKLSNTLTGHNENLPLKWFKTWNNLLLAITERAL